MSKESSAATPPVVAGRPPQGRASWSGLLQLSLVAVPVKAFPAISTTETIRLNQLHAGCGRRIRYQKRCPEHGEVEADAIVKGCQYAPDQYVVVGASELERMRPHRERAVTVERFVDAADVDPALLSGRSLWLLPDGLAARRSYFVLLQAMRRRRRWAAARATMSGQRRLAVVRAAPQALVMHLLHDPAQLRGAQLDGGAEAAEEELKLACALIDAQSGPFDWSGFRDDTAEQLRRLIEAKIEGRQLVAPPEEPAQVLRLLEALQQSVQAARSAERKPKAKGKGKPGRPRRRTA